MDPIDEEIVEALLRHGRRGALDDFMASGRRCGWCSRPVHLREVAASAGWSEGEGQGVVLKPCGDRRETRCPACASVYRDDARHLVRAGLAGGKGVDESVAVHPAVLMTLTAPGFGAVHQAGGGLRRQRADERCPHGRPVRCGHDHNIGDPVVASPLCPRCYDFEGAVLQNACTPELWRRTSIYLPRHLAAVLGISQGECRHRFRIATCRVAEFQRRGVVHLHAVVRVDAVDRDGPPAVSTRELMVACRRAAAAVRVRHPKGTARWGTEVDVRPVDVDHVKRVAAYVAKYSTKSSDASGVLDRPLCSLEDLFEREVEPHLREMASASWRLGADPALARLHLRRYAHALGYGGHFLSKSRSYSTTFRALRQARATWRQAERDNRGLPSPPSPPVWEVVGFGWANRGEYWFADCQRQSRAEERRAANEVHYSCSPEEFLEGKPPEVARQRNRNFGDGVPAGSE